MADIYFSRKESPPGEPDLRKVLGDLYTAYKQMLTLTAEFHHEWKYYGTKIGWQLKVARKGKAILYTYATATIVQDRNGCAGE